MAQRAGTRPNFGGLVNFFYGNHLLNAHDYIQWILEVFKPPHGIEKNQFSRLRMSAILTIYLIQDI